MEHLLTASQSGAGFMPHGMCYLWTPKLLWLHVVSDGLVALAYFAIPPALVYLVVVARRELRAGGPLGLKGLPHDWMFLAFGVFIVACGTTHLLAVVTVWKPIYWISGSAKAVTAMASVATAIALPPLLPRALDLIRAARENERHRLELERAHTQMRALNRDLRETHRQKSSQFANVSHELRTPLTLILGPVERLLTSGGLRESERLQVETIRRNAVHLLAQVEDLLSAALAEDGAERLEPADADLSSLVRSAAAHFEALADQRNVSLEVRVPPSTPCRVDAPKMERVVLNLLSNAFKFGAPSGTVRVTLEQTDDDDGSDPSSWLRVTVEDDGPGIPPDERERIFERFYQIGAEAPRLHAGTGLGLFITRSFVRTHGGRMEVGDSTLGGARFTAVIPAVPAEKAESPGAVPAAGAAVGPLTAAARTLSVSGRPDGRPREWSPGDERPRVLVVEDNAEMRAHLIQILEADFSCAGVGDGEEALALLEDGVPSLVVTDLMMPGMGGEAFVRRLRALPGTRDVPVLVLTARADPALPAQILSSGVQDFLTKPLRSDELLARARNLVNESHARSVLVAALGGQTGDLPGLSRELARRTSQLEQAIGDKETLLRELHHRVKGNLQTVASLLSLQLRSVEDGAARAAIEDSRSRIRAIALLHERLYRAGAYDRVEMGSYLTSLVSDLRNALIGAGRVIDLDVRAADLDLDVERALACGLVAHELIANALEHGVAGPDASAYIGVSLDTWGDDVVLTVQDRGPGLSGSPGAPGLGLDLVRALARQLRGRVQFEQADGLRCELRFPLVPPRRHAEAG